MAARSGARPRPPAMSRTLWPFIMAMGKKVPKGPRRPTLAPTCARCSTLVTVPARRMQSSRKPWFEAEPEMEMGISP